MPSRPSIPTRPSLLNRLRTGDSVEGWQEFYRLYGGLLRAFARKAGLNDDEAEEVVQETAIGVARNLPEYRYDPQVCSFRTWMLNLARWRILDHLRQRGRRCGGTAAAARAGDADSTDRTPLIERVPDPHLPDFGAEWDAAWEDHLRTVALERTREAVDPRQYQLFDLYVLKDRPAGEVARRMGVSVGRVYLAKQRVSSRLKQEMRRLDRESLPVDPTTCRR